MTETAINYFSKQYSSGLQTHLMGDPPAGLEGAHALGAAAVVIGLETLDLAKIHDLALAAFLPPGGPPDALHAMSNRASHFFTEAITLIEETHLIALESSIDLNQLVERLEERTQALENANCELQREIKERKRAETALKASENAALGLLSESRHLEKKLQDTARTILTANEDERKKISLMLQDEIAQTLLGIEVRLIALKSNVSMNYAGLNEEISTIRLLVETSAITIKRLTLELGIHHE